MDRPHLFWGRGEIGKHKGLKIPRLRPSRFKSERPHHLLKKSHPKGWLFFYAEGGGPRPDPTIIKVGTGIVHNKYNYKNAQKETPHPDAV